MGWMWSGREPRFPRLRRLLNVVFVLALIGGVGVGIYFLWPSVGDVITGWLQDLLAWFQGLLGGPSEASV